MAKTRFEDSDVWKLSRAEETEHKLLNCYTMVWASRYLNKSKEVAVYGYGTKDHTNYNILCYGSFASWVSASPHVREYRGTHKLIAAEAVDDVPEQKAISGEQIAEYVWKDHFKTEYSFKEYLLSIPYYVSAEDGVTYIEENSPELVDAYLTEFVYKRSNT